MNDQPKSLISDSKVKDLIVSPDQKHIGLKSKTLSVHPFRLRVGTRSHSDGRTVWNKLFKKLRGASRMWVHVVCEEVVEMDADLDKVLLSLLSFPSVILSR